MPGMVMVAVFVVVVLITIMLGVRIVPQGSKQVVQRLGKYHKTLGPGLNIIMPYIDSVAYKVTTKDIVLDSAETITQHARLIDINAVRSNAMPPGNITEITPEERQTLAAWFAAGAPAK